MRWSLRPAGVWRTRLRGISRPLWSSSFAGVGLRLTVFRRSVQLDRALAEGRSPLLCPQLELRAQQLASARLRWSLADAFRGVAAKAERSSAATPTLIPLLLCPLAAPSRASSTPIAARDALLDLADALTDPGCTSVQGIAQASWLLCDADSPLYARLPARTLQRIARGTIAALHGEP